MSTLKELFIIVIANLILAAIIDLTGFPSFFESIFSALFIVSYSIFMTFSLTQFNKNGEYAVNGFLSHVLIIFRIFIFYDLIFKRK